MIAETQVNAEYYVSLTQHYGFLNLRRRHIKNFSCDQSSIDYLRQNITLTQGTYSLITYWGRKEFDKVDVELDDGRNVLINGINCNQYQRHREYVYALAFSANEFFSKVERDYYRKRLRGFEEERGRNLRWWEK